MNPAYGAYAALSSCLFIAGLPFFWLHSAVTRRTGQLRQRLGVYDPHVRHVSGTPRVWIHAVSVGEVNVAGAVIQALKPLMPGCSIILSSATPHGHVMAREKLGDQATCIYAPLDFILSVRNALSTLRPDVLVCLETEIWPNWLMTAHRMGIKTALINGRFSVRSIRGYLKIRPLMQAVLAPMDAFSMVHADDARRIQLLGAPARKIRVGGNAKYDLLTSRMAPSVPAQMSQLYNVGSNRAVIVAGSTRGLEGEIMLDAFCKIRHAFPDALLIIAPRHMKRCAEIRTQAAARGIACQFRTEINGRDRLREAPMVIVDTMGELQDIYSIATVVFCGGSLVPLGGQNILEPAAWGKPVFYGPSMDDFRGARELLENAGGGAPVTDGLDLAETLMDYLSRPDAAERMGRQARQAVLSRGGAARRHARVISRLVSGPC